MLATWNSLKSLWKNTGIRVPPSDSGEPGFGLVPPRCICWTGYNPDISYWTLRWEFHRWYWSLNSLFIKVGASAVFIKSWNSVSFSFPLLANPQVPWVGLQKNTYGPSWMCKQATICADFIAEKRSEDLWMVQCVSLCSSFHRDARKHLGCGLVGYVYPHNKWVV